MQKNTLLLVTALFGLICGNRLMDNRLLRLSSSSSYADPYESISDSVNMKSFNEKRETNLKLKTLDKTSKPCVGDSDFDFDHHLPVRQCNDNIVSLLENPTNNNNYLTYDNNEDDSINNSNAPKSYRNVDEFDEVPSGELLTPKTNTNNMKLQQQPSLNIFPVANYKDFYDDLIMENVKDEMAKRNGNSIGSALGPPPPPRGCDCKIRNDLVDLGQQHFPRYLLNAVCHSELSRNDLGPKCWSGSVCRPLEYKVKVLTFRSLMDNMQKDPTLAWLPDDLRQIWKFKTVTVIAGCFCS